MCCVCVVLCCVVLCCVVLCCVVFFFFIYYLVSINFFACLFVLFVCLCAQFRTQLDTLLQTLRSSQSHFIRCIKPNRRNAPCEWDGAVVLGQMKSGGLVEALRIHQRSKWSCRLVFRTFVERYQPLVPVELWKSVSAAEAAGDKEKRELALDKPGMWCVVRGGGGRGRGRVGLFVVGVRILIQMLCDVGWYVMGCNVM